MILIPILNIFYFFNYLQNFGIIPFKQHHKIIKTVYLLAPPASGDTIILFRHSGMFSLIHFRTAGSAYKLSTGMSKKPCAENNIVEEVHKLYMKNLGTKLDKFMFVIFCKRCFFFGPHTTVKSSN